MPPRIRQREFWLGRWGGPSGYGQLLALAGPLILSTGSHSIQLFVDRLFLTWHSPVALAASATAGLLSFTIVSFFMGTAAYVSTFVAQYHGAGRPHRIGAAMWQSVYFSIVAGVVILLFIPPAPIFFRWFAHAPEVQLLETAYFRLLCLNGLFVVLANALAGFFSGQGRPWPVVWISISGTAVNLGLDYAWIFGKAGLPAWGIVGAGWATVAAGAWAVLIYLLLFLSPRNRRERGTWRMRHIDARLMRRLLRYGLPSGGQFMLEILCFTLFIGFVGRLGVIELAATNLAFQINLLAFIPMIGAGIATSILVGQFLGRSDPRNAAAASWNALRLTFVYMAAAVALFLTVPEIFINLFMSEPHDDYFSELRPLAVVILRFVALYTLFDGLNLVFASALKGAGDTRFVMLFNSTMGFVLMVLPTWYLTRPDGPQSVLGLRPLYAAWAAMTLYIAALGLGLLWRFLHGRWRTMQVIEDEEEESAAA